MKNAARNWNGADDALVRQHYATATNEELLALLPGRTWNAIQKHAIALGMTRRGNPWGPAEDTALQTRYATTSNTVLAKELGRPLSSIIKNAGRLGLRKETGYRSAVSKAGHATRRTDPKAYERTGTPSVPGQRRTSQTGGKDLEPLSGLAAQLRALPFTDPLRVAYLQATRPGTKAGTAPRTIAQLRALVAK